MLSEAARRGTTGSEIPLEFDVIVIGSGFGGLGTAIKLREAGIHSFVVLERGADVGRFAPPGEADQEGALGVLAFTASTLLRDHAGRIVVLDRGEIAEIGTHAELLAKGGIYANLYGIQYSLGSGEPDRVLQPVG